MNTFTCVVSEVNLNAIAVELDFVNPRCPLGGFSIDVANAGSTKPGNRALMPTGEFGASDKPKCQLPGSRLVLFNEVAHMFGQGTPSMSQRVWISAAISAAHIVRPVFEGVKSDDAVGWLYWRVKRSR